jgi:hypothetical protein
MIAPAAQAGRLEEAAHSPAKPCSSCPADGWNFEACLSTTHQLLCAGRYAPLADERVRSTRSAPAYMHGSRMDHVGTRLMLCRRRPPSWVGRSRQRSKCRSGAISSEQTCRRSHHFIPNTCQTATLDRLRACPWPHARHCSLASALRAAQATTAVTPVRDARSVQAHGEKSVMMLLHGMVVLELVCCERQVRR